MRKKILAFVFAAAVLIATAVPVFGGVGTAVASVSVLPEGANCHGKLVSPNAKDHGGFKQAAADHGFDSVKEFQKVIKNLCKG